MPPKDRHESSTGAATRTSQPPTNLASRASLLTAFIRKLPHPRPGPESDVAQRAEPSAFKIAAEETHALPSPTLDKSAHADVNQPDPQQLRLLQARASELLQLSGSADDLQDFLATLVLAECVYKKVEVASDEELAAKVSAIVSQFPPGLLHLECIQVPLDGLTQHYIVASGGTALYVAFMGTKQARDLVADASFLHTPVWEEAMALAADQQTLPAAHSGFLQRARAVDVEQLYALAVAQGKRLVLCGHSLGGAVAKLCCLRLLRELPAFPAPALRCICFASPAVGNAALADLVQSAGWAPYFSTYFLPEDQLMRLVSLSQARPSASGSATSSTPLTAHTSSAQDPCPTQPPAAPLPLSQDALPPGSANTSAPPSPLQPAAACQGASPTPPTGPPSPSDQVSHPSPPAAPSPAQPATVLSRSWPRLLSPFSTAAQRPRSAIKTQASTPLPSPPPSDCPTPRAASQPLTPGPHPHQAAPGLLTQPLTPSPPASPPPAHLSAHPLLASWAAATVASVSQAMAAAHARRTALGDAAPPPPPPAAQDQGQPDNLAGWPAPSPAVPGGTSPSMPTACLAAEPGRSTAGEGGPAAVPGAEGGGGGGQGEGAHAVPALMFQVLASGQQKGAGGPGWTPGTAAPSGNADSSLPCNDDDDDDDLSSSAFQQPSWSYLAAAPQPPSLPSPPSLTLPSPPLLSSPSLPDAKQPACTSHTSVTSAFSSVTSSSLGGSSSLAASLSSVDLAAQEEAALEDILAPAAMPPCLRSQLHGQASADDWPQNTADDPTAAAAAAGLGAPARIPPPAAMASNGGVGERVVAVKEPAPPRSGLGSSMRRHSMPAKAAGTALAWGRATAAAAAALNPVASLQTVARRLTLQTGREQPSHSHGGGGSQGQGGGRASGRVGPQGAAGPMVSKEGSQLHRPHTDPGLAAPQPSAPSSLQGPLSPVRLAAEGAAAAATRPLPSRSLSAPNLRPPLDPHPDSAKTSPSDRLTHLPRHVGVAFALQRRRLLRSMQRLLPSLPLPRLPYTPFHAIGAQTYLSPHGAVPVVAAAGRAAEVAADSSVALADQALGQGLSSSSSNKAAGFSKQLTLLNSLPSLAPLGAAAAVGAGGGQGARASQGRRARGPAPDNPDEQQQQQQRRLRLLATEAAALAMTGFQAKGPFSHHRMVAYRTRVIQLLLLALPPSQPPPLQQGRSHADKAGQAREVQSAGQEQQSQNGSQSAPPLPFPLPPPFSTESEPSDRGVMSECDPHEPCASQQQQDPGLRQLGQGQGQQQQQQQQGGLASGLGYRQAWEPASMVVQLSHQLVPALSVSWAAASLPLPPGPLPLPPHAEAEGSRQPGRTGAGPSGQGAGGVAATEELVTLTVQVEGRHLRSARQVSAQVVGLGPAPVPLTVQVTQARLVPPPAHTPLTAAAAVWKATHSSSGATSSNISASSSTSSLSGSTGIASRWARPRFRGRVKSGLGAGGVPSLLSGVAAGSKVWGVGAGGSSSSSAAAAVAAAAAQAAIAGGQGRQAGPPPQEQQGAGHTDWPTKAQPGVRVLQQMASSMSRLLSWPDVDAESDPSPFSDLALEGHTSLVAQVTLPRSCLEQLALAAHTKRVQQQDRAMAATQLHPNRRPWQLQHQTSSEPTLATANGYVQSVPPPGLEPGISEADGFDLSSSGQTCRLDLIFKSDFSVVCAPVELLPHRAAVIGSSPAAAALLHAALTSPPATLGPPQASGVPNPFLPAARSLVAAAAGGLASSRQVVSQLSGWCQGQQPRLGPWRPVHSVPPAASSPSTLSPLPSPHLATFAGSSGTDGTAFITAAAAPATHGSKQEQGSSTGTGITSSSGSKSSVGWHAGQDVAMQLLTMVQAKLQWEAASVPRLPDTSLPPAASLAAAKAGRGLHSPTSSAAATTHPPSSSPSPPLGTPLLKLSPSAATTSPLHPTTTPQSPPPTQPPPPPPPSTSHLLLWPPASQPLPTAWCAGYFVQAVSAWRLQSALLLLRQVQRLSLVPGLLLLLQWRGSRRPPPPSQLIPPSPLLSTPGSAQGAGPGPGPSVLSGAVEERPWSSLTRSGDGTEVAGVWGGAGAGFVGRQDLSQRSQAVAPALGQRAWAQQLEPGLLVAHTPTPGDSQASSSSDLQVPDISLHAALTGLSAGPAGGEVGSGGVAAAAAAITAAWVHSELGAQTVALAAAAVVAGAGAGGLPQGLGTWATAGPPHSLQSAGAAATAAVITAAAAAKASGGWTGTEPPALPPLPMQLAPLLRGSGPSLGPSSSRGEAESREGQASGSRGGQPVQPPAPPVVVIGLGGGSGLAPHVRPASVASAAAVSAQQLARSAPPPRPLPNTSAAPALALPASSTHASSCNSGAITVLEPASVKGSSSRNSGARGAAPGGPAGAPGTDHVALSSSSWGLGRRLNLLLWRSPLPTLQNPSQPLPSDALHETQQLLGKQQPRQPIEQGQGQGRRIGLASWQPTWGRGPAQLLRPHSAHTPRPPPPAGAPGWPLATQTAAATAAAPAALRPVNQAWPDTSPVHAAVPFPTAAAAAAAAAAGGGRVAVPAPLCLVPTPTPSPWGVLPGGAVMVTNLTALLPHTSPWVLTRVLAAVLRRQGALAAGWRQGWHGLLGGLTQVLRPAALRCVYNFVRGLPFQWRQAHQGPASSPATGLHQHWSALLLAVSAADDLRLVRSPDFSLMVARALAAGVPLLPVVLASPSTPPGKVSAAVGAAASACRTAPTSVRVLVVEEAALAQGHAAGSRGAEEAWAHAPSAQRRSWTADAAGLYGTQGGRRPGASPAVGAAGEQQQQQQQLRRSWPWPVARSASRQPGAPLVLAAAAPGRAAPARSAAAGVAAAGMTATAAAAVVMVPGAQGGAQLPALGAVVSSLPELQSALQQALMQPGPLGRHTLPAQGGQQGQQQLPPLPSLLARLRQPPGLQVLRGRWARPGRSGLPQAGQVGQQAALKQPMQQQEGAQQEGWQVQQPQQQLW